MSDSVARFCRLRCPISLVRTHTGNLRRRLRLLSRSCSPCSAPAANGRVALEASTEACLPRIGTTFRRAPHCARAAYPRRSSLRRPGSYQGVACYGRLINFEPRCPDAEYATGRENGASVLRAVVPKRAGADLQVAARHHDGTRALCCLERTVRQLGLPSLNANAPHQTKAV
eukprot:6800079-Prymnesium_polylepis.3